MEQVNNKKRWTIRWVASLFIIITFLITQLVRCSDANRSDLKWEQFLKNFNEQNNTEWLETDFQTELVPPTEIHKFLSGKIKTEEKQAFYKTTVIINNHTNRIVQIIVEDGKSHTDYIVKLMLALYPKFDPAILDAGLNVKKLNYGDILCETKTDGSISITTDSKDAAALSAKKKPSKSSSITWEKYLETFNQQNSTSWSNYDFYRLYYKTNEKMAPHHTEQFLDSFRDSEIMISTKTNFVVQIKVASTRPSTATAQLLVALNPTLDLKDVAKDLMEGKLEFGDISCTKGENGDLFITPNN